MSVEDETADDPIVATGIRFGDLEQFIFVPHAETGSDAAVEHAFEASPELCASLCNTAYTVPATVAPLTASGLVGEHQQRSVALDCTELGDPAACEGSLAPPGDYDDDGDCAGFDGWGFLLPQGKPTSIDAEENVLSTGAPRIAHGYLELQATFEVHEEDDVSDPDATAVVTIIANPYDGYEGTYTLVDASGGRIYAGCDMTLNCSGKECISCSVDPQDLELQQGEAFVVYSFQGWQGLVGNYASVGPSPDLPEDGAPPLELALSRSGELNACFHGIFIAGASEGEPGLGNTDEPFSGDGPAGVFASH